MQAGLAKRRAIKGCRAFETCRELEEQIRQKQSALKQIKLVRMMLAARMAERFFVKFDEDFAMRMIDRSEDSFKLVRSGLIDSDVIAKLLHQAHTISVPAGHR